MGLAQRREKFAGIWDRDPHDFYVEPNWVSERLFEEERFKGVVTDPACGLGRIVATRRRWGMAVGSDIVRRGPACDFVSDFLSEEWSGYAQNFVSNPPFGCADQFVELAIKRAACKVAMLLPATWHFGAERSAWLQTTPLMRVLALTPRPSMPPGAVILAGEKPGGGTKDFAWYIWQRDFIGSPTLGWLNRDGFQRIGEVT